MIPVGALLLAAVAQGGFKPPESFEPGATKYAQGVASPPAGIRNLQAYDAWVRSGKLEIFAGNEGTWMPCILDGLVSDQEVLARASFKLLHGLCERFRITTETGKNPVRLDLVNSSMYRAGEYRFWCDWWSKPQNRAALGVRELPEDEWKTLMGVLRGGGDFNDAERAGGKAFLRIKELGPAAYPRLIAFIDHEDPALGRAAVAVLNALSGRAAALPRDDTKGRCRAEWEGWLAETRAVASPSDDVLPLLLCPLGEAEVRALLARLSGPRWEDRLQAAVELRPAVLEHEELLREAWEQSKDLETVTALEGLLAGVHARRRRAVELMKDPEWILGSLARLQARADDPTELGEQVRRFLSAADRCRSFLHSVTARRRRIQRDFGLELPASARWSEAREAWWAFLREPGLPAEARGAVDRELFELNDRAVKAADDLRRAALKEVEAGRRIEAARLLQEALPRFAGTDGGVELDRVLHLLRP